MSNRRLVVATTTALLLLLALSSRTPAYGQTGAGEIWGRVIDPMGEVVERATITVTNIDTNASRRMVTDGRGRFAAPALPAGRYQVTAVREGFAGRRQDDIVLLPGQRLSIEMELRLAALPETIALNPYPPIVESERTHAGAFVADTEIQELPIAGRRYLRLAELTPAVARDAATGGVSVMDLPSAQTRVVIDGFDHTSSLTGDPAGRDGPARVPYQLSQWSVEAFRIHTNGAPAEIGNAGAAVVNVVTKSGANILHGSGYEFFGDQALNGQKTMDEKAGLGKPPYRSNQFGAVIGGPILRNHNFFLISYDGLQRIDSPTASPNTSLFSSADPAALGRLETALARTARDQDQDLVLVRTDHQYSGQHLTLRYVDQQFTGQAIDAARIEPAISSDGTAYLRTRSGSGSLASAIRPTVVNEARVQYADGHDTENPSRLPAVVVWERGSFIAQTGSSLFGPHAFATKRLQMGDSLSVVAGGHSLKAGGDVLRDRNATRFRATSTYGFQTIAGFASGVPDGPGDWYTQTFDAAGAPVHADADHYSAFLQDAWRAARSLTVDLGLRYDLQVFSGSTIPRDRNNWAPRAGLAWAPGDRRHVFRAAYGLFYGATPAMISALAQTYNGVNVPSVTLRGSGGTAMPAYPATLASMPAGVPSSIAIIDPSFRSPRVHQASAGWEMEKYRIGTMGIQYLFARGERLPRPIEINVGGRFADVDRIVSFQSSGQSLYNGITFHERARIFQQLFYTIAYTFSRVDETPQQPIAMIFGGLNERGVLGIAGHSLDTRVPGNSDQHHLLSASAMYDSTIFAAEHHGIAKRLLADWELGTVYTLQSGHPYSAYVNGDINADRNAFNDVAPGEARNRYRLPWQASIDPRVSRQFAIGGTRRLSLTWEAFNISNRPNYTAVDDTLYRLVGAGLERNPLFGRKTGQADARAMQIAARITF